jgi:protein TonB
MQPGGEFALMRDRDTRTLSWFFAASVIVHGILAAAFPPLHGTATVPPPPLEVTLERREPPSITPPVPLPMESTPPRVTEPPKPKSRVPKKIEPPPPQTPAAVPPPVLALPQTTTTPEFAVPAPQNEEKPVVTPREEKAIQAAPGPIAPRAEAPVAAKTTPPISDAAYLKNPQPRYPMSARRRGEQGTVLLKVLVTREGSAGSVSVESSSGSMALDDAALEAVRNWRFVPARRGAQAVEAWHLVPIVFKLEGTS